jgi:serine protease AprX
LLGLPGVNGKGVGIAVIDSGIATFHESLRRRVVLSLDFANGAALPMRPDGSVKGQDPYGHGTHVAGIVAGDVTTAAGRFAGVAPGAHLVNLRVLDSTGRGTTSNVIAAIEWAVANRKAYGIRVINLSVGKPVLESWVDDPLVQAVEAASRAGIVVVASAGNMGTLPDGTRVRDGITSPGNAPSAITVGRWTRRARRSAATTGWPTGARAG